MHSIATRPSAMWSNPANYQAQGTNETDDALIRLSVGIESTDDLVRDFEKALTATSEIV